MTDKRKLYWDGSYFDYWLKRTRERGGGLSNLISGDAKTPDEAIYSLLIKSCPFYKKSVLEIGCGFGRLFTIFLEEKMDIYGVDISEKMIKEAKNQWNTTENIKLLKVSAAEKLSFDDCSFDNVVCIATFDATYQNESLAEMIRVCSVGGNIYISGKNNQYHETDCKALEAEHNARNKGHPNYFTDVKKMMHLIQQTKCLEVNKSFYFENRGDSTENKFKVKPLLRFYDYFFVFKKINHKKINFINFSYKYSETFKEVNNGKMG